MKCENCKAEFSPPPGSSLSICPFCKKPLIQHVEESHGKRPQTLAEVLRVIVANHGRETLLSPRLASFALDYMPQGTSEFHFLKNIIEQDIPDKLSGAQSESREERQIAMQRCVKLLCDILMDKDIAEGYLWDFAEALGWEGRPVPVQEPAPASPPPVQASPPVQPPIQASPPVQPPDSSEKMYQRGVAAHSGGDYAGAAHWFREAAVRDHTGAQNALGELYYYGNGVEKDYKQAALWYEKAAQQGYADAQYSMGFCFQNGQGVAKDYEKAANWYKKAAAQGNKNAQAAVKSFDEDDKRGARSATVSDTPSIPTGNSPHRTHYRLYILLGYGSGVVIWAAFQALVFFLLGKIPLSGWWWSLLRYAFTAVQAYIPLWLISFHPFVWLDSNWSQGIFRGHSKLLAQTRWLVRIIFGGGALLLAWKDGWFSAAVSVVLACLPAEIFRKVFPGLTDDWW